MFSNLMLEALKKIASKNPELIEETLKSLGDNISIQLLHKAIFSETTEVFFESEYPPIPLFNPIQSENISEIDRGNYIENSRSINIKNADLVVVIIDDVSFSDATCYVRRELAKMYKTPVILAIDNKCSVDYKPELIGLNITKKIHYDDAKKAQKIIDKEIDNYIGEFDES